MKTKKNTILITGGAQGLGKKLAEHLTNIGHKVIVLDKIDSGVISDDYIKKISYFQVDFSKAIKFNKIISKIIKDRSINVLINNASMRLFKPFDQFQQIEIEAYAKVNFEAPIILINKVLPAMKKNNFGRIINITSQSGFNGYSTGSMYCSTKSALIVFTESVAKELSKENNNVSIHAICPSSFQSLEGEKYKGYERILKKIINDVDNIINSKYSKYCMTTLTFKEKFNFIIYNIINLFRKI